MMQHRANLDSRLVYMIHRTMLLSTSITYEVMNYVRLLEASSICGRIR